MPKLNSPLPPAGTLARPRQLFGFSPWLVAGLALVLGLAITAMAWRGAAREHEQVTRNFMDRAESLIWALEAGTRTWLGLPGERALLQPLLEETASQAGIAYLAVVDQGGRILAHSDPTQIGRELPPGSLPAGPPPENARWREIDAVSLPGGETRPIFEVYREFAPVRPDRAQRPDWHGRGWGHSRHDQPRPEGWRELTPEQRAEAWRNWARHNRSGSGNAAEAGALNTFALVGFDRQPYIDALAGDRANSLTNALLVAALALGGLLSLFWAESYRRSKRLLRDTQALAAEVVESLPLGLITSDKNGKVAMINSGALSLLGLSAEAVRGKPLAELHEQREPAEPASQIAWDKLAAEMQNHQRLPERELVLQRPGPTDQTGRADQAVQSGQTGGVLQLSLGASQIRGENGAFLGNVIVLRDITEMKRLQEELRRSERLGALGSLAAGVAHEIRNPLSSIKGLATYLASKVPGGGAEEEAARTLVQEVARLNRVVTELLEFSRPGAPRLAPANLDEIIKRALRLAGADLQAAQIKTGYNPAPDSGPGSGPDPDGIWPPLLLDAERLTQALLNLFLNAAQAQPQGGRLDLIAARQPQDGTFSLKVCDSGPGITPENIALIFTPYFTTKPSGTGLGLAIVQQIAEAHGGRVLVESQPGRGSCFTLLLPWNPA